MKITYHNDPRRGAGHGFLRCTDATFGQGPFVFSLARSSDHQFLNEKDWSVSRSELVPLEQNTENGALVLAVAPDVVNQLDLQETYRVSLKDANGTSLSATLKVGEVLYSAGGGTGALDTPPPPPSRKPVSTTPAPEPHETPDVPPAKEEPPLQLNATTAPTKKSLWPFVLAGFLILALVGGAACWFLRPEPLPPQPQEKTENKPAADEKPDAEKNAPQAPDSTPQAQENAQEQKPAADEKPQAVQPLSPGRQVSQFFSGQERAPKTAAKLSQTLAAATPEDQDALYRLYYYASENGETSVLMEYAACLDPSRPQWGTIDKDATLAWEIYEKAKASHPDASKAQSDLKAWVKAKADSGDRQARAWLARLK